LDIPVWVKLIGDNHIFRADFVVDAEHEVQALGSNAAFNVNG
jgi:hypothetical protein